MTHGRRVAALAAALVTALVVGGCSSSEVEPRAAGTGAPVESVSVPGLPDAIDYVALGDSFSAGPFIGTMRVDPEGCARSKHY